MTRHHITREEQDANVERQAREQIEFCRRRRMKREEAATCQVCGVDIAEERDVFEHQGQDVCGTCYMEQSEAEG